MTIGEKIKKLRKEAGMTQAELASKLGLKDSVIAKYENGRIPDLKRTTIAGLAKVFNVSPMDTVLLMIYTGVRIGELLSIEKEDVHIKERYIVVKGTKTANAMRYVPIHEDLVDIVGKMLTKSNKWLVETNTGKKMAYRQYHQFLTCMNKTFGMKHEPHECRYSFATYSAECDMDSRIRKFIMGHSQGNITDDVYTDISKLIPKMVREIGKFDPMKGL